MEFPFALHTPDKKKIQGTIRPATGKSQEAIVFVHGLTGHSSEHIFYNAARFYPAHGIDAIRFDLYPGGLEGRLLPECSITTHANDLNQILEYFRPKYKKLHLVGHSLGAVTVLSSKMQLADSLQLWAPGASEALFDPKMPLIQLMKGTELYRTCWALEAVIGRDMAKQMMMFPPSKAAAKSLCRPTFVACGDMDAFMAVSKSYYKHCPSDPKAFAEIKGAGHQFNEGDTALELYERSLEFIKALK